MELKESEFSEEELRYLRLAKGEVRKIIIKAKNDEMIATRKLHLLLCHDPTCKLLTPESDDNYDYWHKKTRRLMEHFSISAGEFIDILEGALHYSGSFNERDNLFRYLMAIEVTTNPIYIQILNGVDKEESNETVSKV